MLDLQRRAVPNRPPALVREFLDSQQSEEFIQQEIIRAVDMVYPEGFAERERIIAQLCQQFRRDIFSAEQTRFDDPTAWLALEWIRDECHKLAAKHQLSLTKPVIFLGISSRSRVDLPLGGMERDANYMISISVFRKTHLRRLRPPSAHTSYGGRLHIGMRCGNYY
jgi:hypothetical protein